MRLKNGYIIILMVLILVILGCDSKKEQDVYSKLPEQERTLAQFLDYFKQKDWQKINKLVTKQSKKTYPSEQLLRQAINQADQIELQKVIKIIPVVYKDDIGYGIALINYKAEGKTGKDIMSVHMKKENGKWLIAIDPSDYSLQQNQLRVVLEKQMEEEFIRMKVTDPVVKVFWAEYQRQVNKL